MNARSLLAALLICLLSKGDVTGQIAATDPAGLRAAVIVARTAEAARRPAWEARDLTESYALTSGAPLFIDDARRLTAQARAAVALLEQAAAEGLDPDDYAVAALTATAATIAAPAAPVRAAAEFDVLLTASVLRYFRHLHLGRVDPRTLGLQIVAPDDGHDFAVLLRGALDGRGLVETAAELSSPVWQYQALKTMLGRYRALAATPIEPPAFTTTVRPSDAFPDLPRLHRLLVTVGDLPATVSVPAVYDNVMAAGVARFQARHGLEQDGIIGRATQEALAVPLAWRVRQIELALERLRWLPDVSRGRLIAVNIPMFRLWAWDRAPSADPPALTMAVIVGRALGTRTPVFADQMEHLIFRPYWNVPRSILLNEMLPIIRRDPEYLSRENLEIVRGESDASPVLPPSPDYVAELARGTARLRQRPGASNALGLVKFMFPNQNNVYMHDTPAPYLFARSRRDFSHGCIRLEDPMALAEWALGRDPAWTRDAIAAAMNGASNRRVNLPEPIQVVIFYTTAVVLPDDGSVHFAVDIYKQDERLNRAL